MFDKAFSSIQGEKINLDLDFRKGPNETSVPLDDKDIYLTISDNAQTEILYYYSSIDNAAIFMSDPDCLHRMRILLPAETTSEEGKFFLEIAIRKDADNFLEKFQFYYEVSFSLENI